MLAAMTDPAPTAAGLPVPAPPLVVVPASSVDLGRAVDGKGNPVVVLNMRNAVALASIPLTAEGCRELAAAVTRAADGISPLVTAASLDGLRA